VTRRLIPGLLVLAFAVAGLPAQDKPGSDPDEPPVRLKKKDKPAAAKEEPPKPPMKTEPAKEKKPIIKEKKNGDEQPNEPEQPEKDEQEVLNHALKGSRSAEERLAKADASDATQQLQRDVLKDLESLLEDSRRGQQGGSQDQAQSQQQDQQNQQGDKGQQKGSQGKPKSQPGQGGASGGKGRQKGQQQARHWRRGRDNRVGRGKGTGNAEKGQDDPMPSDNTANNGGKQPGGGGKGGEQATNLAEVYKDIWGELPKSLRQEMNAYSREEFMAKYKDVLKQYYATIAEKGRHKE
jgi:hypothetical protein